MVTIHNLSNCVLSTLIQIQLNTPFYIVKSQRNSFPKLKLWWFNEYHKESIQLTNKQMLFNTFDDSLPLQMPISTQR